MTTTTLADLTTKLVELESHPGLEHLRRYAPGGTTAQRWAVLEPALGRLWDDLAELKELSDTDELADRLTRSHAEYKEIKAFVDAVDDINTLVATRVSQSLKQLDAVGAAVPEEITDLLAVSATDPLSLTTDDIERRSAAIAELVAIVVNWPDAVTTTSKRLDALREVTEEAARTRAHAVQVVLTGQLPPADDAEPMLRAELQSTTMADPAALRQLQHRIESALQRVRADEQLAQGLLDRRTELSGRLKAYEAKAVRLGVAEEPDLLSSRRIATALLSRRPCDLRAVTRAVADYQHMVSVKQEKTP